MWQDVLLSIMVKIWCQTQVKCPHTLNICTNNRRQICNVNLTSACRSLAWFWCHIKANAKSGTIKVKFKSQLPGLLWLLAALRERRRCFNWTQIPLASSGLGSDLMVNGNIIVIIIYSCYNIGSGVSHVNRVLMIFCLTCLSWQIQIHLSKSTGHGDHYNVLAAYRESLLFFGAFVFCVLMSTLRFFTLCVLCFLKKHHECLQTSTQNRKCPVTLVFFCCCFVYCTIK